MRTRLRGTPPGSGTEKERPPVRPTVPREPHGSIKRPVEKTIEPSPEYGKQREEGRRNIPAQPSQSQNKRSGEKMIMRGGR